MDSIAIRYAEIVFIKFVKDALRKYSNPAKVLDTVELMAILAESEPIIVQSVARKIIAELPNYTYKKGEFIQVMSQANIDVAEVCRKLGISRTTFYRQQSKATTTHPKFEEKEAMAVIKTLYYMDDITGLLLPLKGME